MGVKIALGLALYVGGFFFAFDAICDCLSEDRGWKTLIRLVRKEGGKRPPYFYRFWLGIVVAICAALGMCALN